MRVAYAIGVARPVSVELELFDTAAADPVKVADAVTELFDLRPAAIIDELELRRPVYRKTASYGHFGRPEREFTWEQTPKADELRRALGL